MHVKHIFLVARGIMQKCLSRPRYRMRIPAAD